MRRPRRQPSYHFERKTRLSPDRPRLELEMRQERDLRRDGCGSSRKRRRDYGRRWGPGQMRRKQVSTFRSEVWRWWRHSVFAPLALLVSGIRAIGCSFTSPRDRTVIWRVDIFCGDEYRCVVSRGYYVFLRFLCVPFLCIVFW